MRKIIFVVALISVVHQSLAQNRHVETEVLKVGACTLTQKFNVIVWEGDTDYETITERLVASIEFKFNDSIVASDSRSPVRNDKVSKIFYRFLKDVKSKKCAVLSAQSCVLKVRQEFDYLDRTVLMPYNVDTQVLVSKAYGRITLPFEDHEIEKFIKIFASIQDSGLCRIQPVNICHYGHMDFGSKIDRGLSYTNAIEVNGTLMAAFKGNDHSSMSAMRNKLLSQGICLSTKQTTCDENYENCPFVHSFGNRL